MNAPKHWHLIDFIITRQRDLSEFMDTRAMRGANCSTDHIMIRSTSRLKIPKQFKKKGKQPIRKLNVSKLKNDDTRSKLEANLEEKLTLASGSVEKKWSSYRKAVYRVSSDVLGSVTKKQELTI